MYTKKQIKPLWTKDFVQINTYTVNKKAKSVKIESLLCVVGIALSYQNF